MKSKIGIKRLQNFGDTVHIKNIKLIGFLHKLSSAEYITYRVVIHSIQQVWYIVYFEPSSVSAFLVIFWNPNDNGNPCNHHICPEIKLPLFYLDAARHEDTRDLTICDNKRQPKASQLQIHINLQILTIFTQCTVFKLIVQMGTYLPITLRWILFQLKFIVQYPTHDLDRAY